MRYEEYRTVGEVTVSKDYEGTPEDIAKLMEYQSKTNENEANITVVVENGADMSKQIEEGLAKMNKGEKIQRQG